MSLILIPLLLGFWVCSWVFVCLDGLGRIFFFLHPLFPLLLDLYSLLDLCPLLDLCTLLDLCSILAVYLTLVLCYLFVLYILCCFLWIAYAHLPQRAFVRLLVEWIVLERRARLQLALELGLLVGLAYLQQLVVVERWQVELLVLPLQP